MSPQWSIFDCDTHERVSDELYATVEEANHDYHMNAGHTYVDVVLEDFDEENGEDFDDGGRTRIGNSWNDNGETEE